MEDTKESSKPAGQTITNNEKTVTNIQEGYEVGMEKSNTSPQNTINIEQSSDVFKKNNIAQKHCDDASPTFGSNMPSRTDSDSSYQISNFTLLGVRPKNATNSSSTPGEVVSVGTISTNHSMRNVSEKKDFAVPANEAVVHPSGNAHETQSQSNKDNHPLAVIYPVMDELKTGTGSVKKIGNIFVMKNKVLGRGLDSVVYEGRLESIHGLPVAVKRVTCHSQYMASKTEKDVKKLWKNLYREVELHRGIEPWRHPNIVGYYQSHVASNKLYIAFQLCQGNLENYVQEKSKFSISSLEVNQDMAEGIRFLHSNSIAHRDLKPQNVFLVCHQDSGCRAVIGDLGLSKATNKGMFSVTNLKGSVGYMAPEVWEEVSSAEQGNNKERPLIQNKSDIFSLGLLFFYNNTNGNHPFGNNYWQCQLKIVGDCQPNFDQIKSEDFTLIDLLGKMFTPSPGSRPTAEEVCKHPALWNNEVILHYFSYCNGKVEAMAKENKSVDKIVPNNILPHGNWMRDLPDNLRHYLKQYRVNGKLPYKGKESSTRYLLCAIRNTAAHLSELPKEVIDDFGGHPAVFWKEKFPKLLTHLYKNIDYSDFTPVEDKKAGRTFPGKKTSLQNKSASNALAQMDDSQSAGNRRLAPQRTAAEETRPMPVQRAKGMDPSGTSSFKDLLTDQSWKVVLGSEFDKRYFRELERKLEEEYNAWEKINPPKELIFNAFNLTPLDKVKLVILGQDPYPDPDQAMGLSFSVPKRIPVPPSLKNMYKELDQDPNVPYFKIPDHGCLQKWAEQGVLLLNAILTVEAGEPLSHSEFGWQEFTDSVIKAISSHCNNVVFLLFGNFAHKKEKLIDANKHAVVKTAHPSPQSYSKFKGCNCFSACDKKLKEFGLSPMDWSL